MKEYMLVVWSIIQKRLGFLWSAKKTTPSNIPADPEPPKGPKKPPMETKTLDLEWRVNARQELMETIKDLEEQFEAEVEEIKKEEETDKSLYPQNPRVYWFMVVGLYISVQVVLGLYGWFSLTATVIPVGIPVNVGVVVLLLQAFHFANSIRSIEVNDLAGFSLLGRPLYVPKSGPYIVPLGILKLIKADRNYKDVRFPGPADKIFRVGEDVQKTREEGGDMPPEGKGQVRPIFVTTGEPRLTDNDKKKLKDSGDINPLDRQLSVEISYFVRYRPSKDYGGIFRIARNLSAKTEEIDKQIKDLIQEQSWRDMQSVLTRHTPATIIENRDLVNEVFRLKLRLAVMRLGIDIDEKGSGLDDLNPSRETNKAQATVAREQFNKLAAITKAEAEGESFALVGAGKGRAEQSRLEGLAKGYKKIKDDLGIDGEDVIASETAKASLDKAKAFVVGTSGVKELFGLVAAGKEALSELDTKKGA